MASPPLRRISPTTSFELADSAAETGDACAVGGELEGSAFADAGAGAGDEGDLTVYGHELVVSLVGKVKSRKLLGEVSNSDSRLPLQQRLGAVDPHLGAGDVVRGVGCEEQDQLGALFARTGLAAGEGNDAGRIFDRIADLACRAILCCRGSRS